MLSFLENLLETSNLVGLLIATVIFLLVLILFFLFQIGSWFLMRGVFHRWIEEWSSRNGVTLARRHLCWFKRGRYWYTYIALIPGGPVFRITTTEGMSGRVWLDIFFFFGGKGSVSWDT